MPWMNVASHLAFRSCHKMRFEGTASGPTPRYCGSLQKVCGHFRGAGIRNKQCRAIATEQRRLPMSFESGGEEGIRTLDTTFAVWRFSKALPSATRPPLRCRSYDSNRPEGSNRKACAN